MLLYVIKSRFWFVGIMTKMRFDPFFLAMMWNKILNKITIDVTEVTASKQKQLKYWTKKKRHVTIYMKTMFIHLDKKTFNRIWKKRLQNEKEIIDRSKALTFLKNCVVGGITKE